MDANFEKNRRPFPEMGIREGSRLTGAEPLPGLRYCNGSYPAFRFASRWATLSRPAQAGL